MTVDLIATARKVLDDPTASRGVLHMLLLGTVDALEASLAREERWIQQLGEAKTRMKEAGVE